MTVRERIVALLISTDKPMSVAEVSKNLGLIHQHAFQETQRLLKAGTIKGVRQGHEWAFWIREVDPTLKPAEGAVVGSAGDTSNDLEISPQRMTAGEFEKLAVTVMSRHLGVPLKCATGRGMLKAFDLVSDDGQIVGDAKFYTMVGGSGNPSAKFSTIAEHVWLLEKTPATRKFLVFGNQREVPTKWLARYGVLVKDIEFYFLTCDGKLEQLL